MSSFDQDTLTALAQIKFPILRLVNYGDTTRDVYTIECRVDNSNIGYHLIPNVITVSNNLQLYQSILAKLVLSSTSGFPVESTIEYYEKTSKINFKNKISGVNGVKKIDNDSVAVNFFDSVRAFGGGSSLVNCLRLSTNLTLKQFPEINQITMCIDKYPNSQNQNCALDFQP